MKPGLYPLLRRLACRDCGFERVEAREGSSYFCIWCNKDTEHIPAPQRPGGPARRVEL